MHKRTTVLLSIFALLVTALAGCARPASTPVRASWSEQLSAAERALKDIDSYFVLVSGLAEPVRSNAGATGEPVELKVTLMFLNQKSLKVNAQGVPLYAARLVHFNDHRLAATLRVDDEVERAESPDAESLKQAGLIRISPQDVLQLTIKEGEEYMGKPVDGGNIAIRLPRASERPTELRSKAAWSITFYRTSEEYLDLWVDAQTGDILMRSKKDK